MLQLHVAQIVNINKLNNVAATCCTKLKILIIEKCCSNMLHKFYILISEKCCSNMLHKLEKLINKKMLHQYVAQIKNINFK